MGWLVKDALSDKKHQQLIRDAQPVLLPGERVLDATAGIVKVHRFGGEQERRGTLLVTDRRVLLQTKRVGGYDVQDFAYGLLTGCNYSTGAGLQTIELVAAGDRARVTQVLREEAKRIGPLIRSQMALSQNTSGPPPLGDPAEQLRKLAELREAGLVSEEEFQAKRTEILGRL
jgi:hypothetical protein